MPPALPLILVPTSEGKAPGGDGPAWTAGSLSIDLDASRAKVIASLASAMKGSEAARGGLLGVKGRALAAATAADRSVRIGPTLPAIERYTGVLYESLDARSLPAAHRRRLDGSVLIVSGLWGVVAPFDPIPDYRLKMAASLPRLGKLSTWWREDLSVRIAERASGRRVWNLLPHEHAAAWQAPEGLTQYTARFLEPRPDGSLGAVSHWNKFLKGSLVRFLLAHPDAGPSELSAWKHPAGFRYRSSLDTNGAGVTVLSFVSSGR